MKKRTTKIRSFYNDIKELIPICRFEPTQAHSKSFYFFDYFIIYF